MGANGNRAWLAVAMIGVLGAAAACGPKPKAHNWLIQEGDAYGYPAAVSATEAKAGQGASDVTMFSYLGKNADGEYVLETDKVGGQIQFSCANPCVVIRVEEDDDAGESIDHITFNPATVIGAALEDAFNGKLQTKAALDAAAAPSPAEAANLANIAAAAANEAANEVANEAAAAPSGNSGGANEDANAPGDSGNENEPQNSTAGPSPDNADGAAALGTGVDGPPAEASVSNAGASDPSASLASRTPNSSKPNTDAPF